MIMKKIFNKLFNEIFKDMIKYQNYQSRKCDFDDLKHLYKNRNSDKISFDDFDQASAFLKNKRCLDNATKCENK